MKRFITITAVSFLAVAGLAYTAAAHEEDEEVQARIEQQRIEQQRIEQERIQQQSYDPRGIDSPDDRQVYEGRDVRQGANDHQVFDRRQDGRRRDGLGQLQRDVDHLNQMMDSVRGKMSAYGANRRVRFQFEHLRAEARQLNNQFRRGDQYYNRSRLRAEIGHMHEELHQIEQNLHFRPEDIFRWR